MISMCFIVLLLVRWGSFIPSHYLVERRRAEST
jgi:hypothetical protein